MESAAFDGETCPSGQAARAARAAISSCHWLAGAVPTCLSAGATSMLGPGLRATRRSEFGGRKLDNPVVRKEDGGKPAPVFPSRPGTIEIRLKCAARLQLKRIYGGSAGGPRTIESRSASPLPNSTPVSNPLCIDLRD